MQATHSYNTYKVSLCCIKRACFKISTRRCQPEKSYMYQGLTLPSLTTKYIYFQRQISKSPRHTSIENF